MHPGVEKACAGLVELLLHTSDPKRVFGAWRGGQPPWANCGWIDGGRILFRGPPSASILDYGKR